jgi:hypothetical protein
MLVCNHLSESLDYKHQTTPRNISLPDHRLLLFCVVAVCAQETLHRQRATLAAAIQSLAASLPLSKKSLYRRELTTPQELSFVSLMQHVLNLGVCRIGNVHRDRYRKMARFNSSQ